MRERRLNIAPAIKKQPFGRPPTASPYDTHGQADGRSPAPAPHPATLQQTIPPFFFSSTPHFYPSGPAYYASAPVPTMAAAQAQVQVSQAGQEQAAAAAQQAAVYQGEIIDEAVHIFSCFIFERTIFKSTCKIVAKVHWLSSYVLGMQNLLSIYSLVRAIFCQKLAFLLYFC